MEMPKETEARQQEKKYQSLIGNMSEMSINKIQPVQITNLKEKKTKPTLKE